MEAGEIMQVVQSLS